MDIERFAAFVRDPKRTRHELETMRANALGKNALEYVRVVDEVLRERFPSAPIKKSGGKTPTTATFLSRTEYFESGKDAYLWLVEQFCRHRKAILEEYDQLHTRAGRRSRGKRFARNHSSLFPEGSSRRGNPSYYAAVCNGWYADVNLNHNDKFAALLQLSYIAKLEYERDWDFRVSGATEQLAEQQESVVRGRKLLEELLAE